MFELLFKQDPHFQYKTAEDAHSDSFFIRAPRWRLFELTNTNPLLHLLKRTVLKDYLERLYLPMMQHQKKAIESSRRDKQIRDSIKKSD